MWWLTLDAETGDCSEFKASLRVTERVPISRQRKDNLQKILKFSPSTIKETVGRGRDYFYKQMFFKYSEAVKINCCPDYNMQGHQEEGKRDQRNKTLTKPKGLKPTP